MQLAARPPLACLVPNISLESPLAGHATSHPHSITTIRLPLSLTTKREAYAIAMLERMISAAMAALLVFVSILIPRCAAQDPPDYDVPSDSLVTTSGTTRLVSFDHYQELSRRSTDVIAKSSRHHIRSQIPHVPGHLRDAHAQADTYARRSQTVVGNA